MSQTGPDEPKRLMPKGTTDEELPCSPRDTDEDFAPDECPMGGDHDEVVIQPATARAPIAWVCKNCRKDFLATE